MPGIAPRLRTARRGSCPAEGLLANRNRQLTARAGKPGTPGLIAPGPGFTIPKLAIEHYGFANHSCSADAARLAGNLIRAGVADPEDWTSTRSVLPFLQRSLRQFIGDRDAIIDRAFSLSVNLSPTAEGDCSEDDIDLRKVYLSFRVVDTVTWINLISRFGSARQRSRALAVASVLHPELGRLRLVSRLRFR